MGLISVDLRTTRVEIDGLLCLFGRVWVFAVVRGRGMALSFSFDFNLLPEG